MFRIRKDGRKWMDQVGFKIDFDAYYFFLMAGFAADRRNERATDVADLIDYFPKDYQASQRLIIAHLCSKVIVRYGIEWNDRKGVHDIVKKLLEPGAPGFVSATGFEEMNAYAAAGVDVLQEAFVEKPRDLETFLLYYSKTIQSLLKNAN